MVAMSRAGKPIKKARAAVAKQQPTAEYGSYIAKITNRITPCPTPSGAPLFFLHDPSNAYGFRAADAVVQHLSAVKQTVQRPLLA